MLDIDKRFYTKKYALSGVSILGKILFYSGAGVPYLDYQVWKIHLRWWHPFSLLLVVLCIPVFGFYNPDFYREMEDLFDKTKINKNNSYFKAPKE